MDDVPREEGGGTREEGLTGTGIKAFVEATVFGIVSSSD